MKTSTTPKTRRGDLFAAACPSRQILNHVTGRWGSLVLVALLEGTQRFSELRRRIDGVSERMLAQALQDLESDGFVSRHAHPVMPPRVDYSLTPMGYHVPAPMCARFPVGRDARRKPATPLKNSRKTSHVV
jgi:DNA-binding HxlR family transcriptional regulator